MFMLVTCSVSLLLFLLMIVAFESGRLSGKRSNGEVHGRGAPESAIFALLGLLVAFTFSGAASRYDARRELITEEANDIGTAFLRADLLAEPARGELRAQFRSYLDARLASYRDRENREATGVALGKVEALTKSMWTLSLEAVKSPEAAPSAPMLLLPALNSMFDAATSREAALFAHPPVVVFVLLGLLCVLAAWLIGFAMAENSKRTFTHPMIFALVLAVTFFVTIDMEYPRFGLIRVDNADRVLLDLRKTMGP